MPENVVDVKLVSSFIDRTEAALKRVERNLNRTFQSMRNAAGALRQGVNGAGLALASMAAGGAVAAVLALRAVAEKAFEVGKELVEQSSKAVELRGNLASLSGTYKAVKDALTAYAVELLVAIQRGGVFQELMAAIKGEAAGLKRTQEELNEATLRWNEHILTALDVLHVFVQTVELTQGAVKTLGSVVGTVGYGILAGFFEVGAAVTDLIEKLTGSGSSLRLSLEILRDESFKAFGESVKGLTSSFDDSTSKALAGLIENLKKFKDEIRGADAPVKLTADGLKALNQQLATAARLRDQLDSRGAIGAEEKLAIELNQRIAEINALNLISERERNELLAQARGNYNRQMEVLNQKRIEDELKTAERLEELRQRILGGLRTDIAKLPDELRPAIDMTLKELDRLNLEFDTAGIEAKLERLKNSVIGRFAVGTLEVWQNFWADMVTGQEGAGKKLIAGLLTLVAKEVEALALRALMYSISFAASGNFVQAAKAAAAAAALGAAVGVLRGAASNLANTSGGRTDGTFQDVPAPTSPGRVRTTQSAGAAGGPQSAGEAYQQRRPPTEVVIRLGEGLVADQLERAVAGNDGRVRLAIQRSMA